MPDLKRIAVLMTFTTSLACGAGTECFTKCGLYATELPKNWTCKTLQDAEDRTMEAFKARAHDPRLNSCEAVAGFSIKMHYVESWKRTRVSYEDPSKNVDEWVFAITDFGEKIIELNFDGRSFAHEYAHVLQHGRPREPINKADPDHSNWDKDGINDAIEYYKSVKVQK